MTNRRRQCDACDEHGGDADGALLLAPVIGRGPIWACWRCIRAVADERLRPVVVAGATGAAR